MLERITERAQDQIMGSMYESATVLADNSDGLFCAYEPDLERFPYLSLSVSPSHYRIDGKPIADVDTSDLVASQVDSRYEKLPEVLDVYDQDTKALTQIGNALRSGQNVALGLEHGELIDVAMAEVGVSNYLRRQNIAHKSALIVSKAIDFMGVNIDSLNIAPDISRAFLTGLGVRVEDDNTVPVRDFLAIAADVTYLTIPSTKTFANIRGLQHQAVKMFNERSTRSIDEDMSSSGDSPTLLGVAVPGTTVKLLDFGALDDDNQYEYLDFSNKQTEVVGYISPGIIKFMKRALTYATAIRLDETPPKVCIDKDFLCLQEAKDVEKLASSLVEISKLLDPNKEYVYDQRGDLPTIRKR